MSFSHPGFPALRTLGALPCSYVLFPQAKFINSAASVFSKSKFSTYFSKLPPRMRVHRSENCEVTITSLCLSLLYFSLEAFKPLTAVPDRMCWDTATHQLTTVNQLLILFLQNVLIINGRRRSVAACYKTNWKGNCDPVLSVILLLFLTFAFHMNEKSRGVKLTDPI